MKTYLVYRNGKVDYDEYDAFVVRAETVSQALQLCKAELDPLKTDQFSINNVSVIEVDRGEHSGVILGSFNAG